MTTVFLVHSFGFTGAPGEFMAFADATLQYHRGHCPRRPNLEGPWSYDSVMLMDDAILIEPDLACRAQESAATYEQGVRMLMGPQSINEDKLKEEGAFTQELLVWGLLFNTRLMTVSVPERRILKGAYLLASPAFDSGNRQITLCDLQCVRGTVQSWLPALPAVGLDLRCIDPFLRDSGGQWALPNVPEIETESAWTALWEALESLRFICSRPELWGTQFTRGLGGMLRLNERLALTGMQSKVVHVSNDATPDTLAACDWTYQVAAQHPVGALAQELRTDEPEETGENTSVNISLAELLGIVTFAVHRAQEWHGKLVIAVIDNMNVCTWIQKRSPRHLARKALRALALLEARHDFEVTGVYVRTYHNKTPDLFSRCSQEEFQTHCSEMGMRVVDLRETWSSALKSIADAGPFLSLGLDAHDQGKLEELRNRRLMKSMPSNIPPIRIVPHGKHVADVSDNIGMSCQEQEGMLVRFMCVGADPTGKELRGEVQKFLRDADAQNPAPALLLEGPRRQNWEVLGPLIKDPWNYMLESYNSTELGGAVSRERTAILLPRAPLQNLSLERLELRYPVAPPVSGWLLGSETPKVWKEHSDFVLEPKLHHLRGPLEPRAAGHLGKGENRVLIYGTSGPLPSVNSQTWANGVKMWEIGKPGHLRCLYVQDLWELQGLQLSRLGELCMQERPEELAQRALFVPGKRVAQTLIMWAAANLAKSVNARESVEGGRVGVCNDPDDHVIHRCMLEWMSAWKRGAFDRAPIASKCADQDVTHQDPTPPGAIATKACKGADPEQVYEFEVDPPPEPGTHDSRGSRAGWDSTVAASIEE
eukprot:746150-Amphidinium_carterae.3